MWRSFLFSTAAAVFFSKEMTGSYLQVDHIWLQVSKTEKWQFLYFFCVWNAWVSAKDIGENFYSKQPCELQNIPELQQSWIKSREEGWSCPVRIRVAANQLQHTLTKTLGEGWSFHWCLVALCFTAYPQILLSQGRPSETRVFCSYSGWHAFIFYWRNRFMNRFSLPLDLWPDLSVEEHHPAIPLRPVYTGDFCCDFSGDFCCDFKRDFTAISNRPCKLLAIQIAANRL